MVAPGSYSVSLAKRVDGKLVSLGEPLYEFSQIPGESGRYLQGFGGDTMNCAIAAARQGARSGYITRLGDDEFGRQFLQLCLPAE